MTYHTYVCPFQSMPDLEQWLLQWKQSDYITHCRYRIQHIPNTTLQLKTAYVQTALTFLRSFHARCLVVKCKYQKQSLCVTVSLQTGQIIVAIAEEYVHYMDKIAQEFLISNKQTEAIE